MVAFRIGVNAFSHDRRHPVSVSQVKVFHFVIEATVDDPGAIPIDRCSNMLLELLHLTGYSHRPKRCSLIEGVSNYSLALYDIQKPVTELVIDTLLDNESLRIEASLCITVHARPVGCLCCLFHVSILQHNERIIASQLKSTFLHVFAAHLGNGPTTIRASGELNSSQTMVRYDLSRLLVSHENVRKFTLVESPTRKFILFKSYASMKASSRALAHWGVLVECFIIIGFPIIIEPRADLKGIQNGKL